jgi:hypothetical protein
MTLPNSSGNFILGGAFLANEGTMMGSHLFDFPDKPPLTKSRRETHMSFKNIREKVWYPFDIPSCHAVYEESYWP